MSASTYDLSYRRAFFLAILLLGAVAFGMGRLAYFHFRPPSWVPPQPTGGEQISLPAQRGNIYDCNGYLLAVATTVYDIGANPAYIEDKEAVADQLVPVLEESKNKLLTLLHSSKGFVRLKRGVSAKVADKVRSLKKSGLRIEQRTSRYYPNSSLAACVLGFVREDGQPGYGLEAFYNDLLAGTEGHRQATRDPFGSLYYDIQPPKDGAHLILTLDRNLQAFADDALAKGVQAAGAAHGVALVMDPATGSILAMSVFPTYDPNLRDVADQHVFVNTAVSEHYEPGSVFKTVTMAAGLDSGVITPESTYYDSGRIVVGGETIENADKVAYGETSMRGWLAHSYNVGAATVSTKMGAFQFYEYVRRFGFAELTGADLAYEVPGRVRFPGDLDWHESDLATNSFGQGLAVTPLQMLRAFAALANQGVLMRPYIVSQIVNGDRVTQVKPQPLWAAVSAQAAAQTTEMLVYAVDHVLTVAAIPGYKVAGKSGTSQVPVPGGYDPDETIASFAAFAPADDPRAAVLVVVQQPQKEHGGLKAAAPICRDILKRALELLAVPPDGVRIALQRQ